jgi:membrane-associated phospholipid phosphatase
MVFNNKMAAYSTIIIMILTIIFHILILTGVVPYEITWGGRLKSYEDMLWFETISILVNITVILIVAAHMRWVPFYIDRRITRIALWLLVAMFALNTIGNIIAVTVLEKTFGILTLLLAVFCAKLALSKE